ncbi:hypothetical protein V8C86DRAFT_2561225 [Haematococcus lacustris]
MIGDLIDLASPLPSGSAKQAADAFPIVHDVPIVLAPAPTRVATISLLDHTADGSGLNLGFLCAPSTATKPDQEWPALHSPDTRDVAVRLSFGAGIPPYIPPGLASHMHSEQEPRCLGSTGPAAQLPPADERKLTGIEHSAECPSQPVMLGTSSSVSPVSALQTVMGPTDAKVLPSTKDEQRLSPQAGRAGGPSVTPAAMPKPAQPAVSGAAEGGLVQGPCQPVSHLPCVTDLHSSSIPDSENPETCAQTAAAARSASCPVEVPAAMPAAGASGAVPLDSQPVPRVESSAGADKAVQHWPSSALVLSELSEVQARLSKVEASRESLARDLGQHKAAVARLEGSLSSKDKQLRQQAEEIAGLKARAMQAERDAATLRVAVDVTPERCRTSAKALLDEANRAQAAASTRTAQVRKLQQVVAHEAEELRTLQAFANEERLALLTSQTSLSTELAAEQAARAGLQAELAAAQAQLLAAQQAQQDAKKEVWDAKNQSIELAAEAHQLRAQVSGLQEEVAAAKAQAADAAEGCTRSLQELGEVRDMGVKLFKQIRAVAHALDRNSHHFQRVPEVALSIRQLQDWCTKQGPYWSQQAQASVTAQASAPLSAAGAPGPPSSTAAAAAGDGCGAAPLAGQAGTTAVGVEAEAGALQGGGSSSNSVLNGCAGQAGFRGGAPGEAGHTTLSFSVAGLAGGPGSSGAPGLQVVAAAARPPEVPATPAHCQLGWAPGSGFAAADVTLSLSHFRSLGQ